jgi:hypothetical protein
MLQEHGDVTGQDRGIPGVSHPQFLKLVHAAPPVARSKTPMPSASLADVTSNTSSTEIMVGRES